MTTPARFIDVLRLKCGAVVQENVPLAPYTSARIGGPADILVTVKSANEFAEAMKVIWDYGMPYSILGSGSNVLVSDKGFRGVVVLDRAKDVRFEEGDQPTVWSEAGVILSNLANRCASKGFSGLEWAATVPGTVGGAVYGNAGAFGGDMSANLIWAEVLTKNGREKLTVEQMAYGYRASVLKSGEMKAIVLSALLRLKNSSSPEVSAKISEFSERRKSAQPPGASMGSMFKNPAGDHAGRLIEAAGLKGTRIGNAEISAKHANFFINHGETRASDVRGLIDLTRQTVFEKFGIHLELEVELIGEWNVERSTINDMKKLRIAVLFGGRSGEHDVSLMSARSVLGALDPEKYEVTQVGITLDGEWYNGGNTLESFTQGSFENLNRVVLPQEPSHSALYQLQITNHGEALEKLADIDVFFPVLHGPFGEDGTIQGLLELADAAYVGAGVVGSAVGMDKAVFKDVMRANGIPIVESMLILRADLEKDMNAVIGKIEKMGEYPFFAKPANLGSSVGISKCNSRSDLGEGLMEAARFDRRLIVEKGARDAREIEVSVLGNEEPQASVCGEVLPSREFYSYESKYIDGTSGLMIPAELPAEVSDKIREYAIRAYKAIDCAGMARADFFVDGGTNQIFLNELNTLPGFTSISMYPKLWQASGLSYPQLVDRLIELALERKAQRDRTERRRTT